MEPERGEGERTLDERAHDDARRDGSERTDPSTPTPLSDADRRGYDPGSEVAGLKPIPRALADGLRRRLAACQDTRVDGDLAHDLSLTAILCAWLAASLHVGNPAVEADPLMARARMRLEDAMADAPVRQRLDETNGTLKRISATLARLAQSVDANGDAIGAGLLLAGYTAAWQASPQQAIADHIDRKNMVDVTWPQAMHAVERAKAVAERDGTGRTPATPRRAGAAPARPAAGRGRPMAGRATGVPVRSSTTPATPGPAAQPQPQPQQARQPATAQPKPAASQSQPKRQPTFEEIMNADD